MRKADEALTIKIETALAPFGARKLSAKELKEYKNKDYVIGWEVDIQIQYKNNPVQVRLLFDPFLNHSLPTVVLHEPKLEPLSFPHLELNGKLCVWPNRYIVDLNNVDYIESLLHDIYSLLSDAFDGKLDNDFEDEFISYWHYYSDNESSDISILDNTNKKSRLIKYYKFAQGKYIFGDSENQIVQWLDNQNILPQKESNKGKLRRRAISKIESSAIIFLNKTINPKQYPSTLKDLYELITLYSDSVSDHILEMISITLSSKSISLPQVLLSFATTNGQALVGLRFSQNLFSINGKKSPIDGFRDAIPLNVLVKRTKNIKTKGRLIQRLDPSWVIGRDANSNRKLICEHTVAVIGCGSIGSTIARLLIKSGITKLILIDGDTLETENFGRHELGYRYNKINKALALKHDLCKDFPYISITAVGDYFSNNNKFKKILNDADIVLSATANWYSDQQILTLQAEEYYPIVFTFVEANALAGHVIVNPPESNAYKQLHHLSGDRIGSLKEVVTKWPTNSLIKIPACAGEFQPYGATEICHIHSIATKKIISILTHSNLEKIDATHSIWFGDTSDLMELGGTWNYFWENYGFDIGPGSRLLELSYLEDEGDWCIRGQHAQV